MGVIEKVRDSAFTLMFKHAKYVVDLYEELTGKRLDPLKLTPVNLGNDVRKPRLYNDVAFLTEDNLLLVLIEHQTSLNFNMLFRMLEYFVALAGKYIKEKDYNKYGTKQIQIPKAQFFVVYNGKGEMPELPVLDLGDVQVKAQVQNIHFNKLKNQDKNNALAAYSLFVEYVATGLKINEALDQVVADGYLTEFFGRKEYRDMFAEVFSYDQELIDSGIEQGETRKNIEHIDALLDILDDETIAIKLKVELSLVQERRQLLGL